MLRSPNSNVILWQGYEFVPNEKYVADVHRHGKFAEMNFLSEGIANNGDSFVMSNSNYFLDFVVILNKSHFHVDGNVFNCSINRGTDENALVSGDAFMLIACEMIVEGYDNGTKMSLKEYFHNNY